MKGVSSRGSNRWMGCSFRGSRRPGVCSFVFSSTWKAEKEKRSSDHFIPCRVAAARARFKPGTKNPRLVFYMGQSTSVVSQDTLEGSWIRSRARSPANTLPHSSLTHCATTNESLPLRAWGLCCSTSFDLPQVPWGRESKSSGRQHLLPQEAPEALVSRPTVSGEDVAEHGLQLRGGPQLPQDLSQALRGRPQEWRQTREWPTLAEQLRQGQGQELEQNGMDGCTGNHLRKEASLLPQSPTPQPAHGQPTHTQPG